MTLVVGIPKNRDINGKRTRILVSMRLEEAFGDVLEDEELDLRCGFALEKIRVTIKD